MPRKEVKNNVLNFEAEYKPNDIRSIFGVSIWLGGVGLVAGKSSFSADGSQTFNQF